MSKLIALIALCTNYLAHADGYADLVAIQKNFPRLVSQTPIPGIAGSAPEVPYVAGSLGDPKPTGGENPESDELKEELYAMGQVQRAKEYKAINFSPLNTYNKYKDTGHSTFGIAAQERVDLSPAPPILLEPPAPLPQLSLQGDDESARPFMPDMLAGFGGFKTAVPAPAPVGKPIPAPAPVGKPILVSAQQKLAALRVLPASKDNAVDIAILEMLVAELTAPVIAGRSEEEITKLEELKEFFALLETPPTTTAGQTKVGRLRMRLKPKQVGAVAFAVPVIDPVEAAIEKAVNTDFGMNIPRAIIDNKKAVKEAMHRIKKLGVSAKDFQKRNLSILSMRYPLIPDDDESEDESSGDDDQPVVVAKPKPNPISIARPPAPAFLPKKTPPPAPVGVVEEPKPIPAAALPPAEIVPAKRLIPPPVALKQPQAIAQTPAPGADGMRVVDIDTWAEQEFQREKQSIFDEIDRAQTEYDSIPLMKRAATGGNIKKRIESLKTDLLKYEGFAADNTKKQIKTRYPRFR